MLSLPLCGRTTYLPKQRQMPKISQLPLATTFSGTDMLPFTQEGTTKRIAASTLIDNTLNTALATIAATPEVRWTPLLASTWTARPGSSNRITSSNAGFAVGLPVRIQQSGVYIYLTVLSISGSLIYLRGPALSTSVDMTEVTVGGPERVAQYDIFLSGNYPASLGLRMAAVMQTYCRWMMGSARLVAFAAAHRTSDPGVAQPKINVTIAGNRVGTQDSTLGISLTAGAGVFVDNAVATISNANYEINFGDLIDIEVTSRGTNFSAADLTVSIVFVLI